MCWCNLFFFKFKPSELSNLSTREGYAAGYETVSRNVLKCLGLAPEEPLFILSFLSYCVFVWQEKEISYNNLKISGILCIERDSSQK